MLVDTAGRSPRDLEASRLFDVFAGRPGVRTHLVVPAGSTSRELASAVERFADARPARVVLTKVDEAVSLAPLVSWVRGCSLRLSFLGTGQRVPEDLVRATAPALAGYVLGEEHALAGSLEC
jgi:flagellar biosynthesis protein FlhF